MDEWTYYFKEFTNLDTVDDALRLSMKEPLEDGNVQSIYLKHVIDEIAQSGPYMAITTDVLFLHTRDHESVKTPFISYVHLKQPMDYYGKKIFHVFAFGSFDDRMHRRMLSALSHYVSDIRDDQSLMDRAKMKDWFVSHMQ